MNLWRKYKKITSSLDANYQERKSESHRRNSAKEALEIFRNLGLWSAAVREVTKEKKKIKVYLRPCPVRVCVQKSSKRRKAHNPQSFPHTYNKK